jgi:hypothetical protein
MQRRLIYDEDGRTEDKAGRGASSRFSLLPIANSNRTLVRNVASIWTSSDPHENTCRWSCTHDLPLTFVKDGQFASEKPCGYLPHQCVWKPEFTAGTSWAGRAEHFISSLLECSELQVSQPTLSPQMALAAAICPPARRNDRRYPSIFGNPLLAAELSALPYHEKFPCAVQPATFHEVPHSFITFCVPTPQNPMTSHVSSGSASVRTVKAERICR